MESSILYRHNRGGDYMGECIYLQGIGNYNYYCTLIDEQGLVHPECSCRGCKDYNCQGQFVRYAERVEEGVNQ